MNRPGGSLRLEVHISTGLASSIPGMVRFMHRIIDQVENVRMASEIHFPFLSPRKPRFDD